MEDRPQGMTAQQQEILRQWMAGDRQAAARALAAVMDREGDGWQEPEPDRVKALRAAGGERGAGTANLEMLRALLTSGSGGPDLLQALNPGGGGRGGNPPDRSQLLTVALPFLPAQAQRAVFLMLKVQEAQRFQPVELSAQEAGASGDLMTALSPFLPDRERKLLEALEQWRDTGK